MGPVVQPRALIASAQLPGSKIYGPSAPRKAMCKIRWQSKLPPISSLPKYLLALGILTAQAIREVLRLQPFAFKFNCVLVSASGCYRFQAINYLAQSTFNPKNYNRRKYCWLARNSSHMLLRLHSLAASGKTYVIVHSKRNKLR